MLVRAIRQHQVKWMMTVLLTMIECYASDEMMMMVRMMARTLKHDEGMEEKMKVMLGLMLHVEVKKKVSLCMKEDDQT